MSLLPFLPRLGELWRAHPLRTMAIWLALVVIVFLTRNRWEAWVVEGEFAAAGNEMVHASPDGETLVFFAPFKKQAVLWSVTRRVTIATLPGYDVDSTAVFAPEGSRALVVPDLQGIDDSRSTSHAALVNTGTGERMAELSPPGAELVSCFSRDGTRLFATWELAPARIWDAGSGRPAVDLAVGRRRIMEAQFSPDGTRLITSDDESRVHIWDTTSGVRLGWLKCAAEIEEEKEVAEGRVPVYWQRLSRGVCFARFSRNGKHAVVCRVRLDFVNECTVFGVESGKRLASAEGQNSAFSPCGRWFSVIDRDWKGGRVFDAETGALVSHHRSSADWSEILFTADGEYAYNEFHTEVLWNAATGEAAFDLRRQGADLMAPPHTASDGRLVGLLQFHDDDIPCLCLLDFDTGSTLALISGSGQMLTDDLILSDHYGRTFYRRIRPEWWWGVFYLWHFWVIAALGVVLALSVWKDVRDMRRARAG